MPASASRSQPGDLTITPPAATLPNERAVLPYRVLLVLFLVALVVRLFWVGVFKDAGLALDDMYQYDMLGRSLAEGNGFRWYKRADMAPLAKLVGIDVDSIDVPPQGLETTFRAPLYPAFLSAVYYFSGFERRLLAARLAQAVLGAMLAPLAVLLARQLRISPRGATIAGLILGLYPILTMYPLALVTEDVFLPLTLLGLLFLLRAAESRRRRDYLLAGLIFGLAALARSIVTVFLPVAVLALYRQGGRANRQSLLILAAFAAVTLPWAVRNTVLTGAPAFVETSLGYNLFIGYHPAGNGTFRTDIAIIPLKIVDDKARDQWTVQQAVDFVRAGPGRLPELILNKWRYFWGLEKRALVYFYSNGFFGELPRFVLVPGFLIVVLPLVLALTLAIAGLIFAPEPRQRALVLLFAGSYIVPHLLIMAEDRFHLVLTPVIAAYAGHALVARREILAGLKRERRLLLLTLALVSLFLVGWGVELASDWPKLLILLQEGGSKVRLRY